MRDVELASQILARLDRIERLLRRLVPVGDPRAAALADRLRLVLPRGACFCARDLLAVAALHAIALPEAEADRLGRWLSRQSRAGGPFVRGDKVAEGRLFSLADE